MAFTAARATLASAFVRSHWRRIGWAVPVIVLSVVLVLESDWRPASWQAAGRRPAAAPQPVSLALLDEYRLPGGLQAYAETINRPLLAPDRRPAPPPPALAPPKPAMQKGRFALLGTLITSSQRYALLREIATGKFFRSAKGSLINDILVAKVDPNRVTLRQGEDSEVLVLKVVSSPPPAAGQGAPPPANVTPFSNKPFLPRRGPMGVPVTPPGSAANPPQTSPGVATPGTSAAPTPAGACPPGTPCAEAEELRREQARTAEQMGN